MLLFIPRPQNQVPNRTGILVPSAKAVPLPFRKQSRSGRATVTALPSNIPRRTRRLLGLFIALSLTSKLSRRPAATEQCPPPSSPVSLVDCHEHPKTRC